jgi:transcriptional regulator with GAF, ATPase, and Fis domain
VEDLFPNPEMGNGFDVAIGTTGSLETTAKTPADSLSDTFFNSRLSLDDVESMLLREAVSRANGNYAGAARMLGLTRPQLAYRLKKNAIADDMKDAGSANAGEGMDDNPPSS